MDNGGTASYDASTNQFTLSDIGANATVTFSVGVPVESFPITNRVTTPVSDQKSRLTKVRVDAGGNPVAAGTAVYVGETVYYQVTVANASDTAALASQTVTDVAGAGLQIQSATAGTVSADGTTLTWDTGEIAAGGKATVTVTATVTPAAAGLVTNTASTPTDTVVTTDPVSKITVAKTLTTTSAAVGDTATYEIVVTNNGTGTAVNVPVADAFEGLTYVSCEGATWADGTFTVASIGAGESATITATYTVASTPFTNSATSPSNPAGSELAKVRVDAGGSPVAAGTAVYVGETVYYQVTVANTSDTAALASQTVTDVAMFPQRNVECPPGY